MKSHEADLLGRPDMPPFAEWEAYSNSRKSAAIHVT
jgi:hypothetical protein